MQSCDNLKGGLNRLAEDLQVSVFFNTQCMCILSFVLKLPMDPHSLTHTHMILCLVLQVTRIGPMHQAGSDSLLTAAAFFALRDKYFGGHFQETTNEAFVGSFPLYLQCGNLSDT